MRYFLLGCLLVLQIAYVADAQSMSKSKSKAADSDQLPKFKLVYLKDGPFERECSSALNKPIKPEDANEIDSRLKEFQSEWEQWGDKYIKWTIDEFHFQFPYRELRVTLTACEFPSMSTPFIIYAKGFLSSSPRPHAVTNLPIVIFHEAMHIYLRAIGDTNLLQGKYSTESKETLAQIPVMALEVFVLKKSGQEEVLKWLDTRYRTRFTAYHKRAWEIVNDIEGYEKIIADLKSSANSKPK